jgi:hypothetical protein
VIWTGARALWHGHESSPGEYLFVQIQDYVIESVLGAAWPRCPLHGAHPLDPGNDDWVCPVSPSATPEARWAFGTLANHPAPAEPVRPDGAVRWWLGGRG